MNPETGEGYGFTGTDGKYHEFRFDLNAICTWEDKTGKGFGALEAWSKNPSLARFSDLRALAWAGLLHERNRRGGKGSTSTSPMRVEDAGGLIPVGATMDVFQECVKAAMASLGADDEEEEEPSGGGAEGEEGGA